MDDVFVYCIPLPSGIRELVTPCDGGYTVYISDSLLREEQTEAYSHALRHITGDDFQKTVVAEIETTAH